MRQSGVGLRLTFHELLACVLLEEGIVDNGAVEVVEHEEEDGLDLLLGVARVVRESSILMTIS